MPRLRQSTPDFVEVGRILRGYGVNGASLSRVLGCAPGTARKKLNEPKHFTLEDLELASRHYGIPFDRIRDAIKK